MNEKPLPNGEAKRGGFMDLFTLTTTEGRLKSTFLMYAFSLSLLLVLVYAVASFILVGPLESVLAGRMPVAAINLLEAVIPAMAGTLLIVGLGVLLKDKRLLPTAFGLLLAFSFALFLMIFFSFQSAERAEALTLYLLFVPAPVLIGSAAAYAQYALHGKKMNPKKQ